MPNRLTGENLGFNVVNGSLCHGGEDWRMCACGHDELHHLDDYFGITAKGKEVVYRLCDGEVVVDNKVAPCGCIHFRPVGDKSEFQCMLMDDGSVHVAWFYSSVGRNRKEAMRNIERFCGNEERA